MLISVNILEINISRDDALPNIVIVLRVVVVIWVVVDRLTKMVRFIVAKTTITTPELTYQFVDELFHFYGLPMDIMNDRDPKFTSDF